MMAFDNQSCKYGYNILTTFLIVFLPYVSAQTPQFYVSPEDTTALAGTDVTFYCTIVNLNPNVHSVLWYKGSGRGGLPMTNGSNILQEMLSEPHRFFVMVNRITGQYNLVIRGVTLSDDANYYCAVHQHGREYPILSSDPARLDIHKIPDEDYPMCRPLEKAAYKVGETFRLTCKSERGNPPVMLTWNRGNRAIHSRVTQDDTIIGYRHLHYDLTVTAEDQGATFQCKMTTSAASETFQRSCSLGPLEVLSKPTVSVQSSPGQVVATETVSLFCDASGNPAPNTFKWTFSKTIDPKKLSYHRNNQQLDIVTSLIDNQTSITCNATNLQGSGQARYVLLVLGRQSLSRVDLTSTNGVLLEGGTKPPKGASSDNSSYFDLKPEVLAVIAGTIALIVLVLILLILVTCRCTYHQNKSSPPPPPHPVIYGSPELYYDQGSVYFEPKDRISVREMPTLMRPAPWHRTVGVQVPHMEDEESTYEEIGQDWDEGTVELRI